MNRTDLQQLADERIRDADALLKAGQWSGAYYLAGYAVECALKACIAKLTDLHEFPDKDRAVKSFSHDFENLLIVAGLKGLRDADISVNAVLRRHWLTVKDWKEAARYQRWTEAKARELFVAVADAANGVLPWITAHW